MKIFMGRYPGRRAKPNKERVVRIRIDDYDLWGMCENISAILVPMLERLKEIKHGGPIVNDEDVPEDLRDAHLPKENDWDTGIHHFEKWDWVLSEMIWAFKQDTFDSEEQFHSGKTEFLQIEEKLGDEIVCRLVRGPNDTHVYDKEGHASHMARMAEGRRLFAKYYHALWD